MEDYSKDTKILHYTNGNNIRELVQKINKLGVGREDVVGIVQQANQFYILYYYGGGEQ